MKILLISDFSDSWSCHNRCKAIAKFCPDIDFTIRAENEIAPGERPRLRGEELRLLPRRERIAYRENPPPRRFHCLREHEAFDVIHFNFTSRITEYRDFLLDNRNRCLVTIVNERAWFQGFGVDGSFHDLIRSLPWKTSVSNRVAEVSGAVWIPNGIDQDIFDDWKRPVVGFIGTKNKAKNGHLVSAACKDLGLELRTAIYAGDTPHQPIPHHEMKDWYKSLDVYVHASESEGCNNTILEALACQVPVLMTRVGCWQEFEGFVEFVEPTVASIKAGLLKWCCRRLIAERFLWKDIVPRYEEIYEQITGANRV